MSKKKIIFFAVFFVVVVSFIISWSTLSGKMYNFNFSPVDNQTGRLSFEIKTPRQVPFKKMKVSDFKVRNNHQEVEISLANTDKNMIDIRISKVKPEYKENKKEIVTISKDSHGKFIGNASGRRILTWEENEVFYEIIYYPKLTPKEVSKKQLINMAKSFK